MLKYMAVYIREQTAYLGDENSYSHAAACLLADGVLKHYDSMSQVISAVIEGECAQAVLPTENNVEGAVNEVYDMMFDSGLFISRQLVLPIRHSLIAAEGATMQGITRVMSHAQAIAQCRMFLKTLPVTVEATLSTSEALKHVSATTAAIAYRPLAGQKVLATGIQDSALNATRFSLFTKQCGTSGDKVSVSFDLKNEPGTLLCVLGTIHRYGVNMTRILSRPHRSGNGEYRFFIDFDYTEGNERLGKLLSAISEDCTAFRFLGRYYCDHPKATQAEQH